MALNIPKLIIIHCSDVSEKSQWDQFNNINTYHRDVREFPVSSLGLYVGYHALITGGKLIKCRESYDVGAHCNQQYQGKSVNFQSLGICVGFDGDVEYMSQVHYDLLKKQVKEWQEKYDISDDKVFFHRDFAKEKTCPGSLCTKTWLKELLSDEIVQVVTEPIKVPVIKPVDQLCTAEKKQISNLQSLIASLISLFKKT